MIDIKYYGTMLGASSTAGKIDNEQRTAHSRHEVKEYNESLSSSPQACSWIRQTTGFVQLHRLPTADESQDSSNRVQ